MTTTVTGAGYAADSLVTVTSEGMTLGTASTDETGSFRMVIAAPSSVAGGYEITAADEAGTSRNVTLTVPDLTGPTGVDGDDRARGEIGPVGDAGVDGVDGNQGAAGPTGEDASLILGVVALALAGLGILIIIVIYLYLISWFKDLARRLPPPGIR